MKWLQTEISLKEGKKRKHVSVKKSNTEFLRQVGDRKSVV